MTTLRERIDEAIHQIDTYKYPDIGDVQEELNIILKEGTGHSTGNDAIEYMAWSKDALIIRTGYSVRGCLQSEDFTIPTSVFDAREPGKALLDYTLVKKITRAKHELVSAQRAVEWRAKELDELETKLKEARAA